MNKEGKKRCAKCGQYKQPGGFYLNASNKDGLSSYCKECHKDAAKESYWNNWQLEKKKRNNNCRQYKADAINMLGGKCVMCGTQAQTLLTIHHVNHDGSERRANGEGLGTGLYLQIKNNAIDTDSLAIVCANCHRFLHRSKLDDGISASKHITAIKISMKGTALPVIRAWRKLRKALMEEGDE